MTTWLELAWTHNGTHRVRKSIELGGSFVLDALAGGSPRVDEARLLLMLPPGWLPAPPADVLLIVGGVAVATPKRFRLSKCLPHCWSLTLREVQ